jgi:hypothetical protein
MLGSGVLEDDLARGLLVEHFVRRVIGRKVGLEAARNDPAGIGG